MPDGKEAFWKRWIDYWVSEYQKENPTISLGAIDDMHSRLKEEKPWKDWEHVTDYLREQRVYPELARFVDQRQTPERVQKLEEAERLERERMESRKKTTRELLLDYEIDKEDANRLRDEVTAGQPGAQEKLTELNQKIKSQTDTLLRDIAVIKELSNEGYDPATAFLQAHMREVIVDEVGRDLRDTTKYEIEEMRKKMKSELDRVRKAVDKIESTVTKDEMREYMAAVTYAIGQIPGVPAIEVPEAPEAKIPRYQALEEARALWAKGQSTQAVHKLRQGGFGALEIQGLREEWARYPPTGVPGGGVSADEMRRVMREEMERQAAAGPVVPEDYDVEWLQNPQLPECWDQYSLGNGMRDLAYQKLSLKYGFPVDEISAMVKDKRITQDEFNDFLYGNEEKGIPGISTAEVVEKLIKTGYVEIIKRNPEFERRLMQLPFPWGNGKYFMLGPEGRRKSAWAVWNRLDTLCKVVVEMMETGTWNYRILREAGVPSSFIRACRREVRGGT
jgi:hypothetical protein